jgi:hypothetical protein
MFRIYIGAWEQVNDLSFNVMEFSNIRNGAGSNSFINFNGKASY